MKREKLKIAVQNSKILGLAAGICLGLIILSSDFEVFSYCI
jgi:hypothetical protein